MLKRFMLAALVLAAGSLTLLAADKSAKPVAKPQAALIQKTYSVADLVVLIPGMMPPAKDPECCPLCLTSGCPVPVKATCEDTLIQLITSTVRPQGGWS